MDYFKLYPHRFDEGAIAAWNEEIAKVSQDPEVLESIRRRGRELLPSLLGNYRSLRALPRGTRRAIQRHLARSREIGRLVGERFHGAEGEKLQRRLAGSLAGAALLLALGRGVVEAATITVTTNLPTIVADGRCSLPEAIINANDDAATHADCAAGSGGDTIVLPASATHSLNAPLAGADYVGYNGLPPVTSTITIEGNGGRISRSKNGTLYRLLAVTSTGDLTLNNLSLSGGREYLGGAIVNGGTLTISNATISGAAGSRGGAVFNGPGRRLTISGSSLTKNGAYYGGGVIFNNRGTVTIENSTISKNTSSAGGAVYSYRGTVEIENSTVSGNKAIPAARQPYDWGGGVFSAGSYLTISDSVFSKNSASYGAGIMARISSVEIENSVISGNKATVFGGGVFTYLSYLTVEESEFTKNSAVIGGGIANITSLSLEIKNSTISGNKAANGAGISSSEVSGTIDNSTISANKASNSGGGISHSYGSLVVTNSTITGNSAARGGGIDNAGDQLNLGRTIVAGNKATTGREINNQTADGAATTADDVNLFGVSNSSGVVGFAPGATDIVPSVALGSILSSLSENGGPTPTHALVTGSPAIDAVPGADPGCGGEDQRGVSRPQGAGCDIGAFEKQ
jgi:hypothetical protein